MCQWSTSHTKLLENVPFLDSSPIPGEHLVLLFLSSKPGLMDEGVGACTDKVKTWGNRQGKDMEWAREGCGVEVEQLLVVKANYG